MQRALIIRILIALLVANLASARMTGAQGAAASASAQLPHQLASGAQVDTYLTQAHFHGYILLVRHGRTILSKGYGMADAQHEVPITAQTRWPMIGGAEIFMMAIAIMKLQAEGKLNLQDELCTYLTDCPPAWQGITIRGMLDGTSTIGYTGDFLRDALSTQGRIARTIAQCRAVPMLSAPPGVSNASSCNGLLLSRVIAQAAHERFGTAMQQLVFQPARMTSTSVVTVVPPQSARGYNSGAPTPPLHAGGYPLIYATLGDIQGLDRALLADSIISPQAVRTLITPYRLDAPDPSLTVYDGYGCQVLKADQFFFPSVGRSLPMKTNRVVFQNGGLEWGGLLTDNFLSPDDGSVLIEAVNDTGLFHGDADNNLMEHTAQLLWGR